MDKAQAAGVMVGIALIAYGIGYIHGQQSTLKDLGSTMSKEGLQYLAYVDVANKFFGKG